MDLYTLFKFLHVATLFFAVALAISGEIVVRRVATSGDVRAIRTVVERVKPLSGNLAPLLFMTGIGFGFVTAFIGGLDLLRPWLVLSYGAVVAATILGIKITDPWLERLSAAAATSPEEPSAELAAAIDDPRARYASFGLMILIATLVFLMVVKPLG